MAKYKVVKANGYDYVYDIYQQISICWKRIGHISLASQKDEDILAKAKEFVSPKTIYFDA